MREIVCLHYSPWSERALFALDHHQLVYRQTEYVPMLGEPALRIRLKRFRGKLTVPILLEHGEVIDDSRRIAEHAERIGKGSALFPESQMSEIERFAALADAACNEGRIAATRNSAKSAPAQRAALEATMPKALTRPLRPVAHAGIQYLLAKYGDLAGSGGAREAMLSAMRTALDGGDGYLVGDGLTWADLCCAAALQFVSPVADEYIRLKPAERDVWGDPELAREYRDVAEWRDALYAKHRRGAGIGARP